MLVERGELGGEASGAAAGILAPQVEAERPGPFLDLALASRARYPDYVAELEQLSGLDLGYRTEGTLALAHGTEETQALAARFAWQTQLGLSVERLTGREVQEREPNLNRCDDGLY